MVEKNDRQAEIIFTEDLKKRIRDLLLEINICQNTITFYNNNPTPSTRTKNEKRIEELNKKLNSLTSQMDKLASQSAANKALIEEIRQKLNNENRENPYTNEDFKIGGKGIDNLLPTIVNLNLLPKKLSWQNLPKDAQDELEWRALHGMLGEKKED